VWLLSTLGTVTETNHMATRAPAEDTQQNIIFTKTYTENWTKIRKDIYLPSRKAAKREYIKYSPSRDLAFPYMVPQPIYHSDH